MRQIKKVGVVLGSGGARGWAHIAALERLVELGIKPYCVVGTSIGSIIGGLYCAGHLANGRKLVESFDWRDLAQWFFEMKLLKAGLLRGDNIVKLLRQADLIGEGRLCDLQTPFAAVATDLFTEKPVLLEGELDAVDAIRASIAIPGIFTPQKIGKRTFVDGGLTNPLAINYCRDMGADVVIAVDVNLRPPEKAKRAQQRQSSPNVFDVVMRSVRVLENVVTRNIIAKYPPDVLIQPAVGHVNILDFYEGRDCLSAGRTAVDEKLDELRALGLKLKNVSKTK